jgi:hypothetical protein
MAGPQMFRLVAKFGGLFSIADIMAIVGERAKNWAYQDSFPKPCWRAGKSQLYAGWDVWVWMENTNKADAADKMHDYLMRLRQAPMKDVV